MATPEWWHYNAPTSSRPSWSKPHQAWSKPHQANCSSAIRAATRDGGDLPGPRHPRLGAVEGILVALDFKPQAKVLAAERGIGCVQVDYDELRGVESDLLRIF
jgi:RecB family endonuclease NucS